MVPEALKEHLYKSAARAFKAHRSGAVVLLAIGFVSGAGAAKLFYAERIQVLESQKAPTPSQAETTVGSAPLPSTGVIASWGGGDLFRPCVTDIVAAQLADFASRFDVALICGFGRKDVDRLTDTAISKSGTFSIDTTRLMKIEAPLGQDYMRVALFIASAAPPELLAVKPPPGMDPVLTMAMWYDVVLLPKGITTQNITSLSDVERLGGRRHSSAAAFLGVNLLKIKEAFGPPQK